jgi:hypothetical protein
MRCVYVGGNKLAQDTICKDFGVSDLEGSVRLILKFDLISWCSRSERENVSKRHK